LFPASAKGLSGDLLFFVHGYNNSVDETDLRHRILQAGLTTNHFQCPIISFDWPAGTCAMSCVNDRHHVTLASIELVDAAIKLLLRAQTPQCDIRVHVLGHSGGALAIREAFNHADDGQARATNWTVGQLVLIAGDVSSFSFLAADPRIESAYRHCYRLTNYFNGYDEVLQVSNAKRAGLAPRLGRVGLPDAAPKKAVNVDCSAHFRTLYGESDGTETFLTTSHVWYFSDAVFQKDLAATLRGTIDRDLIPTRNTPLPNRKQSLLA
jgi:esterase/lipase superfamily enzyme